MPGDKNRTVEDGGHRLNWMVAAVVLLQAAGASLAAEPAVDLSQFYGFQKLEIFKLETRSANMCVGDLNHDGRNDIAVADNSHSRIDLLQQRNGQAANPPEPAKPLDANELASDRRFEHRKIAVDNEISAMALGDFNGDGRTDIAYFGVPDRLVIRLQPAEGEWTERTSFRLPDVPAVSHTLAGGDLNHDGKDDVVVLGKNSTYVLYQKPDGSLATPQAFMNTSASLATASITDLDGDGRNDLSYLSQDNREQFLCVRLQDADGHLGPELNFDLKLPRSVTLADVDGKPGREILSVDARTNRVRVLQVHRPEVKPGELAGRLVQYGFGQEGADRDRDLAIGDLDGDGLSDVVVTDPEVAQMIVYRQQAGRGLDSGSTYPGLVGASQVRISDLDANKAAEVVVLSSKEKTLAVSRLEAGRLTFPAALPVNGEPLAFDFADLNADGRPEIVYIAVPRDGRRDVSLQALSRDDASGDWRPFPFGESPSVPLKLSGNPTRIVTLDANRDGRPDFLVFAGIESAPQLYTTDAKGTPVASTAQRGIGLGEISPGSLFLGHLDQPAVLAAWKNFARNLQLDAGGQWTVIDQYNADESTAKIVGVATINLDGEPGNEIVLVDSGVGKLRVLHREMNLYRPWREVEIGGFPFKGAFTADLNGDANPDLLLFGKGKFGVLYAGQTDPALRELSAFETGLEKTFFRDVVGGDLNGDGQIDLAAIDSRSHFIEILNLDAQQKLRHALNFKLFEEKSIGREEAPGSEPREAAIADVTGDGLPDLILLSHDRILLFPQDSGKK